MFKFNFVRQNSEELGQKTSCEASRSEKISWFQAEEIFPDENLMQVDTTAYKIFSCTGYNLKYVTGESTLNNLSDGESRNILQAETLHSDLVPGKYEGGMKIWECTIDLVEYILKKPISFQGKKILDLGCGVGIIGIVAALQGATVHFQDYNAEVLKAVTIPSVYLNLHNSKQEILSSCRYFAGDWSSFVDLTEKDSLDEHNKYDYILSSETIYNTSNNDKLYSVFKRRLKTGGAVFIAAKTYYFGVGGGTRQFEDLINKEGIMKSSVCWQHFEGIRREILEVTFR